MNNSSIIGTDNSILVTIASKYLFICLCIQYLRNILFYSLIIGNTINFINNYQSRERVYNK